MFGAISLKMILRLPTPLSLARSTKSLERNENICALMARAAHGQDVSPMKKASGTTPLTGV